MILEILVMAGHELEPALQDIVLLHEYFFCLVNVIHVDLNPAFLLLQLLVRIVYLHELPASVGVPPALEHGPPPFDP